MFKRVLHRDAWGPKQVIIACLSTGDQGMDKTNYQWFSEALCPGTILPADKQEDETAESNALSQESP